MAKEVYITTRLQQSVYREYTQSSLNEDIQGDILKMLKHST